MTIIIHNNDIITAVKQRDQVKVIKDTQLVGHEKDKFL